MVIQDFILPKDRPTAYSDLSLMAELYIRGYKIEDIFARFFEFDVHAVHLGEALESGAITVEDITKYAPRPDPNKVKKGEVF